jgi:hypothetical protein
LPRCLSALAIESREAGREAVPSEYKYVARQSRPAGDFCSRLFRCSPSLTLNLPKGSHSKQVRCSSRGLCTFYRHAGVIVPPGEPPDGTSPAVCHVSITAEAPAPPHAITVMIGVPDGRN